MLTSAISARLLSSPVGIQSVDYKNRLSDAIIDDHIFQELAWVILGAYTTELFSVHGSLFLDPTRPDPTRRNVDPTRPDPRLPTKSLTRPDPTRPTPSPICAMFMSSTFKLPTGNNIQLLHDFKGNIGKYRIWLLTLIR